MQELIKQFGERQTNVIVDNQKVKVGDVLRKRINDKVKLSFVSAYFTIYAYEELKHELESVGELRFLYGEPRGVGIVDHESDTPRSFELTNDGGMKLKHALRQKALAQDCAEWIRKAVNIRTVKQANFLHGKMYHINDQDGASALIGSSNFTRRGLGYGLVPNIELNLEVCNPYEVQELLCWFDQLWTNDELTQDVKQEVLAALERLGKAYSPEFVYYKTLFHLFEEKLAKRAELDDVFDRVHLYDTEVWDKLYEFQKDGAKSVINRLLAHNGCILADSVGLGKTWTALAVIKYFELRNERVLVLCPKKLEDNWLHYTATFNDVNNPFEKDRFNYVVMAHTDLNRNGGHSRVRSLQQFNWSAFDLIVIDESHNFRNTGHDKVDKDGVVERKSRYNRLIEDVIGSGVPAKVLMLSATPVNTKLRDLRNQIYLMTEKRKDAFHRNLGIKNVDLLFKEAQRELDKWQKQISSDGQPDKNELINILGTGFLTLLDAVTIARSRSHIKRYYPKVIAEIGKFPTRTSPDNLHPGTDINKKLTYEEIDNVISKLNLAIYTPSLYLLLFRSSELNNKSKYQQFTQKDREQALVGMMRMNLLKRLESSAYSFTRTVERIHKKVKDTLDLIKRYQSDAKSNNEFDSGPDEDEEDDDFIVGKKIKYKLEELDLDRWGDFLNKDQEVLSLLLEKGETITVARDAKLAELKQIIAKKVYNPTYDKDSKSNRKILVFTTFADTAQYLYTNLEDWIKSELGVDLGLVMGGDNNKSTIQNVSRYEDILGHFAPIAQQKQEKQEIDILIATDCLSEGQNLQDCDQVINYDIHWNPTRLMQRFGRIDRLGSRNNEVKMVNFWPTDDLETYLNLKSRVEARMALAVTTATGGDNPLTKDEAETELKFRDEQLKRLHAETFDLEDAEEGVSLSDLTLDDFLADLLQYIQQHRKELEEAPFGIYAIVDHTSLSENITVTKQHQDVIRPGVIFCLKHNTKEEISTPNAVHPWYLVYIRDDGTIRFTYLQPKQCLTLFQSLCQGKSGAKAELENAFDLETKHGQQMEKYEGLLNKSIRNIANRFSQTEWEKLRRDRGMKITKVGDRPTYPDDFELITWLVIVNNNAGKNDNAK